MSAFVLDASATFAWFFDDEVSDIAEELERRSIRGSVHVPSLWLYEVANGLWLAEQRHRIRSDDIARFYDLVQTWRLVIDPPDIFRVTSVVTSIARETGLTSYDAAYLELAQRHRLPLASHDGDLVDAARKAGVMILGEES